MEKDLLSMYVSCWGEHDGAPGLSRYTFDQETGEIAFAEDINKEDSLNCSCIDPKRNKMYVNNEVDSYPGEPCASGRIFVYDLDPETGKASECMRMATECPNPAYVSIDQTGRYLFEAHHSLPEPKPYVKHVRKEDGTFERIYTYPEKCVQVYALSEDGLPEKMVDCIDLGSTTEWVESNPHSAVFSPSGKLLAVADKGSGYLYLYTFDYETERLKLRSKTLTDVEGAHPRYVAFHPTKPYVFVNHEAALDGNCNVSAFRYDEEGNVEKINMVNAFVDDLPLKPTARLEQQGFVIDPEGKYLYTAINSPDAVGVLAIDQETGALTAVEDVPVQGQWVRGLAISPNGKYILTTCLVTGEISSFARQEDGTLKPVQVHPGQKGAAYLNFF